MNTLLLLDDESVIRRSFADYFEDQLWSVMEAESGEQALQLIKQQRPQAVLVDIRLPGIDGGEFIRQAYQLSLDLDLALVFIICTGSPDYVIPEDIDNLSCVCKRIFAKPVANFSALEQEFLNMMQVSLGQDTDDNE